MTGTKILRRGLICLSIVLASSTIALHTSTAQVMQPAGQPIATSKAALIGTLAPDTIKDLASHWDGTKLPGLLKLSTCDGCADEAVRKALASASKLGPLKAIRTSNNNRFVLSGSDGGSLRIFGDDRYEVSPAKGGLKFEYAQGYLAEFEGGSAKISVVMRGTHEARELVMIHIRPVEPAAFAPVTLGKPKPEFWEKAMTW